MGYRFCPYCGCPIEGRKNDYVKVITVIGCIITAILSLILIFELIVGLVNIGYVFDNLSGFSYPLFLVVPVIVDLCNLSGIPLYVYYVLLLIAATSSVLILFLRSYKDMKEEKDVSETPIYETAVLFGSLYVIEFAFILIVQALGVEIDTPAERPNWEWMFELLNASVWEELITRVLYLGVPVTVISLVMKKEGASAKWMVGGFGIDRISLIFILFSATMFAAGHLNGWGTWKLFPTFLFGLIAGYLFCRYGLYATICFHFMTDYLQAEKWVLGTDTVLITGMALLIVCLMSIPFVWVYLKKGCLYLRDQLRSDLRRS